MQFYGKTDSNNYLTDISTNPQNGFSEFSVLDKYAPFLPQYFSKIWIKNGIAQVPDNLPITQFEQEKADWDTKLKAQSDSLNALSNDVDTKISKLKNTADDINKEIDTVQKKIDEANAANANINSSLVKLQLMFVKANSSSAATTNTNTATTTDNTNQNK